MDCLMYRLHNSSHLDINVMGAREIIRHNKSLVYIIMRTQQVEKWAIVLSNVVSLAACELKKGKTLTFLKYTLIFIRTLIVLQGFVERIVE